MQADMRKLRILVADDSQAVRNGLRILLEGQPEYEVVAEAADGREVIDKTQQYQPDLVILDYSMPELDGLSAVPRIRQASPRSEILVLTQHDAPFTVRRALAAGVRGYVVKSDVTHDLLPAVEAMRAHKIYLSAAISGDLWSGARSER